MAALAGLTLAGGPYVSLEAVQPLFDDFYGVSPRLGLGVGFAQSSNFAFRTELAGLYGTGIAGFSSYRKLAVTVRAAQQVNLRPVLDAYLGAGVMYAYARERRPWVDTNGVITDRWGSGSAMGLFTEGGVVLARGRKFRLDFEVGLDIGAVRTDMPLPGPYQLVNYVVIPLSGFSAGFVFSLAES